MKPKQTSKREWEKEFEHDFGAFAILGPAGRFYNGAFANEARIHEATDFISSLLQSYADEVREKVIEDCLHDFHGAIDISNIVDYDEAKQALSTLNKRYGIKNKDENN